MFTGKKSRCFGIVTLLVLAIISPARATDFVWDGEYSDRWTEIRSLGGGIYRTNWDPDHLIPLGDMIPEADDEVFFVLSTPYNVVDLDGSRVVRRITFAGSAPYTLSSDLSTDMLTLVDGDVTAIGTATHRFNVNVGLDSDGAWLIDDTATMQVNRFLYTSNTLTKTGTGTLSFTDGDEFEQSSIYKLVAEAGAVLVDGGHIDLTGDNGLVVNGGDVTLQNAANVQLTSAVWGGGSPFWHADGLR